MINVFGSCKLQCAQLTHLNGPNEETNFFPKMISHKIIAGGHWREIEDLTVKNGLAEIDRTERKIYFENPPEKIVLNFPPVKVKLI